MKGFLFALSMLIAAAVSAQKFTSQSAWQQHANYTIQVTLNDDSNYLTAFETIEYFNNSPDDLNEILIHLYPNAYKDNSTAFAQQKIAHGDTKFWMSDEKDHGFIDGLDFKTGDNKPELKYSNLSPDCAKLILKQPLKSGQSLIITTPFRVKIPYTFSRLGRVGKSYQISQWFPKIAVYDANGWNQMPYLDQGEFYSDYGNYDVTITLPKNYIVAATGNLQTESEINWLNSRIAAKQSRTDEFADNELKTIRYTENNIHDFAFFADKRWCVAMEEVSLPSGKKVAAWAFDTLESKAIRGVGYIKKALIYLSEHVGEYPYNTAKSCTGALSAGAGMEYPTVTVVDGQNEAEVVHEIGHNWFYGILGSNERRYPWMDEGINSFYESLICTHDETMQWNPVINIFVGKNFFPSNDNFEILLGNVAASRGEDAPLNLHAAEYSTLNYGTLIYKRTALNFGYLKGYLGSDIFDSCMKYYYAQWNHRHPLPDDIKNCFELVSGKNLHWFFNGVLCDYQNYDIKISKVIREDNGKELEIHLQNKTHKPIAVPIKLSNPINTATYWIEPFINDTIVHFHNYEYDKIEVNDSNYYVETKNNNNYYFLDKKHGKSSPLQFRILAGIENHYHRTIYWFPIIGYNTANKGMAGVAFYNSTIQGHPFEYSIAPLYSFNKKNLNGYVNISNTFFPRGAIINTWALGLKAAKFDAVINTYHPLVYTRLQPFVQFNFTRPSDASLLKRFFRIDFTTIAKKATSNSDTTFLKSIDAAKTQYLNFEFNIQNTKVLNPYSLVLRAEKNLNNSTNNYFKLTLKGRYNISYENPKRRFHIEAFAGKVFYKSNDGKGNYDNYLAGENAYTDYKYWYPILNRDAGTMGRQLFNYQGGVRSNVLPFNTSKLGATLKLSGDLPFTSVIRPYLDFGWYQGIESDYNVKFFYTSGISVVVIEDVFEINFPLALTHTYDVAGNKQYEVMKGFRFAQSGIISDAVSTNNLNYWQTVTFLLCLDRMNPVKLIRTLQLNL